MNFVALNMPFILGACQLQLMVSEEFFDFLCYSLSDSRDTEDLTAGLALFSSQTHTNEMIDQTLENRCMHLAL